jgi:hypothetical protein
MDRVIVVSNKNADWEVLSASANSQAEQLYYDGAGILCTQSDAWQFCMQYGDAGSLEALTAAITALTNDRLFILVHMNRAVNGNETQTPAKVSNTFNGNALVRVIGPFSHVPGDQYWKWLSPVIAAIIAKDSTTFRDSLAKLIVVLADLPGRLYEEAIKLLNLFLPVHLALQVAVSTEDARRLPSGDVINQIETKLEALCREANLNENNLLTPVKSELTAISQNDDLWGATYPTGEENFEQFHQAFTSLRDRLFEIVEAIERGQGQKA